MVDARLEAVTPIGAFCAFALALALLGYIPAYEASVTIVSVALAFGYSGWSKPAGWRRRCAEGSLIGVALTLLFIGDPTMRRMALPPILMAASCIAFAAANQREDKAKTPWLVLFAVLATRCGGGLGLIGYPWWQIVVLMTTIGFLAFSLSRSISWQIGLSVGLLAATFPVEKLPVWVLLLVSAISCLAIIRQWHIRTEKPLRTIVVAVLPISMVMICLAPWGGPKALFLQPFLQPVFALILLTATVLGSLFGTLVAGVLVFAATLTLGSVLPPPPDLGGLVLDARHTQSDLPLSQDGPYLVEIALGEAAHLPTGTEVALLQWNNIRKPICVGVETAEWAHDRVDVRGTVKHSLPKNPVWRPNGEGRSAFFGVAGRIEVVIPKGLQPLIVRNPGLEPRVSIGVTTAGPSRPTPPRDWPALSWIFATALIVGVLQLLGGCWRQPSAWVPWALLAGWRLALQLPIEPLRILLERHAVDLCLLALLAAWFPLAWRWLGRGWIFASSVALLLPLALAAPMLAPPGVDERYHTTLLRSITRDFDIDLTNNYELENHPENSILVHDRLVHSPVLAVLLAPGYFVAGRTGALGLLALAGAALAALSVRLASMNGLQRQRARILAFALLLSYPLVTFSTQMWVEVPGALAGICCLLFITRGVRGQFAAAGISAFAAAMKTRLGLATLPVMLAEIIRQKSNRKHLVIGLVTIGVATAIGLSAGLFFFGHLLGPLRRFEHLLPTSPRLALVALGGLLFDPAGGLAFSTPFALVALASLIMLWRKDHPGIRGLIIGMMATVLTLMNSPEWYGGGGPPGRYLVPFLPLFALSGAVLLTTPRKWRRLGLLLLPTSMMMWFALVSRPHFTYNPGDGGWWLADLFAVRLGVDTRHLIPSFLRPQFATFVVPLALLAMVTLGYLLTRRYSLAAMISRASVSLTLITAVGFISFATLRYDRVIEIEDPQILRLGGQLEPQSGTFSRFAYPNGWRIGNGEGVDIPINLSSQARIVLDGWLDGPARHGCTLLIRWDQGNEQRVVLSQVERGQLIIPSPGKGRHRLQIRLDAPVGGQAVLDRLVVER